APDGYGVVASKSLSQMSQGPHWPNHNVHLHQTAEQEAYDFEDMVAEKQLIPDGCGIKYISNNNPWTN
ncbi:hypothetical protein E2I00_005127, partial [Balaenoptera physalus]